MPYDPITLHFNDGKDGERLRCAAPRPPAPRSRPGALTRSRARRSAQDEGVRYRAALRARHLQVRSYAPSGARSRAP